MINIRFIGYGNMAQAIIKGLIQDNNVAISASSPSQKDGINDKGVHTYSSNVKALPDADVIVLAIKPHQFKEVIDEIKPHVKPSTLIISIAAGLPLSWLKQQWGESQPVIRAMPNTPLSVGEGVTILQSETQELAHHKTMAEQAFNALGQIIWVERDEDVDSLMALTGCGPAYVFLFIEALVQGAVHLGIDEAQAQKLAIQTVKGSVLMAEQSEIPLHQLRQNVMSPGGATEAAIKYFLANDINKLVASAMQQAHNRAIEMSQVVED